jgi:serine O-acetyltransferase
VKQSIPLPLRLTGAPFFDRPSPALELLQTLVRYVYTVDADGPALSPEEVQRLTDQIALALQARQSPPPPAELPRTAHRLTMAFLRRLGALQTFLKTDVQAAFEGDPAAQSREEILLTYPGIYAVTVQRLAHELQLLSVPLLPRLWTEHAHSLTGIDIHPGAVIGSHFFIDHGTGVVIGQTSVIGNHVKLYQGVTLGAVTTKGGQRLRNTKRHPTLEDYVTVYAGASVLGGSTVIGHHSVVGSGVLLTASLPPYTRVTGKPPELYYKENHTAVLGGCALHDVV